MSQKKDHKYDTHKEAKKLSAKDIEELIASPFDKKVDITKKIADYYKGGGFNEEQLKIAMDIFRLLVQDTETAVRKALAESLKDVDNIPHDVVLNLAHDIEEVSLPVLEYSDILTDIDLIEIVQSTENETKHVAIAKRKEISENVVDALIDTQEGDVVDSLLNNEGAKVSEESYNKIINDFSDHEKIMESMVTRGSIPVHVVERLADVVSEAIYTKIAEQHKGIFASINKDMVNKSKEVVTMNIIGKREKDKEFYEFSKLMKKLEISEELFPIAALCTGNMHTFEVCVARATKISVMNVRTLVDDESNKGFEAIYQRSHLPEELFEESKALVDILRDMGKEIEQEFESGKTTIARETAAKLLDEFREKAKKNKKVANADYIISLIQSLH